MWWWITIPIALGADDVTVGSTGDYATLEDAWSAVTNNSRIRLLPGSHSVTSNLDTNGRALTVESADPLQPALLDLGPPTSTYAFVVGAADSLTVRHVTVSCLDTVGGFDAYGTLVGEHIVIENCVAPTEGGAIYSRAGSSTTLVGGRIAFNSGSSGGGVYAGGTVAVEGTTFEGNSGGAMRMASTVTNVVRGATFVDNDFGNGGAIYVTGSGGATWIGNRFLQNTGNIGSAIKHSTNGPAEIRYNHFEGGNGNTGGSVNLYQAPPSCLVEGNHFTGNQASTGGNMYIRDAGGSPCTVRGNRFELGTSTGSGGGVFIGQTTVFEKNLVCNNTAGDKGGGLAIAGAATVSDTLVLSNQAANGGGGIDLRGGGTVSNSAIAANTSGTADSGAIRAKSIPVFTIRDTLVANHVGLSNLVDEAKATDSDFNGIFATDYSDIQWLEGPASIEGPDADVPLDTCSFEAAIPAPTSPLLGAGTSGSDIGITVTPDMLDADGDGYMGLADCDDADGSVHPGADELCGTTVDEDCDGLIDSDDPSAIDAGITYADGDGDGAGLADDYRFGCEEPGWAIVAGDCSDADPSRSPLLPEIPGNNVDEDCNGVVSCYADLDGDGFGDLVIDDVDGDGQCTSAGEAAFGGDCDDDDNTINPDALEVCDGVDNDCDGDVDIDDTSVSGTVEAWPDADADGFGGIADPTEPFCTVPSTHVENNTDCNDLDATVNPDAPEICNGKDDDCNGAVDDDDSGVTGQPTFWFDMDGDGFGGASTKLCNPPPDLIAVGGDCNDAQATVFPGAPELCNGIDDDCDPLTPDPCPTDTGDTGFADTADTGVPPTDTGDTDVPEDTDPPQDTDPPEDTAPPVDTDLPDEPAPEPRVYVRGPALCSSRAGSPAFALTALAFLLARRRRG